MEKIDMILWIMGGGFAFMLVMWNNLTKQIGDIGHRIDKLDEKLTDVDRRLCRMEGAFTSKECCVLQQEQRLKKVE